MDDLHTPSVAAGPTSRVSNGVAKEDMSLTELMAEKDRVQSELSALSSVLDSHGVNMRTSLTTFDGYPRDDIDIAQIRTTRARIIHLQNDLKGLYDRIEKALHAHHASLREAAEAASAAGTTGTAGAAGSSSTDDAALLAPFARVNDVVSGSPADNAGLKAGDKILKFGEVNWMNHEKLSKLAETVAQNVERPISIRVARDGESSAQLDLQLTPRRNWGGRGMLGCHLLPL
ncbi:26S proteasome non-ATPase regulatory subunit 9 [Macrophomina phaseolina]|uniref:26S proteasome non-ATPase regulatory subunit 9 n=1 Tax=Macrophomina phaseolina TaxID=35725 RepID=A0ABQ8GW25_9PEZI|nr:26S proteasome non-ATPase regulatory subunit 9 [Macrophomina phaseolina]